jgi:hypothetical protein
MTQHNLERDIPAQLRELSAATPEPAWDAMEQRLLGAFAEQRASADCRPLPTSRSAARPAMWRAAAAAVVVLAAAITFYPRPESRHVPAAKPAPAPRDVTKTSDTRSAGVAPSAQNSSKLKVQSSKPEPRALNSPTRPLDALPPSPFSGFVALPGASALPDFESGRIMRIELTLTELPAYGLDMVLDATQGPVEADLLVGQDGVPRAIRLAPTDSY